jgi:L-lactate dehydrogenase (cytochrome)
MLKYRVIPVTSGDYRRLAAKRLPRFLFDYIDGGSGEERSMARNRTELQEIRLEQRVMRDVAQVRTKTELLGQPAAMPLLLAPLGLAGMFRRRGEAQAARAASRSGVPFATSTVGICPVEEVQAAAGGNAWFQLYMMRDRGVVDAMLQRAQQAGCRTLVFTVDLPVTGKRYRDDRKGMLGGGMKARAAKALQLASRPGWLWDVGVRGKPHEFGNLSGVVDNIRDLEAFKRFIDEQFDPSVTWKDIEIIRSKWPGKLLVKGVMNGEDANSAFDSGADGVVVSNHGGRQIDGVASTISRLPRVVDAAGKRGEIYLDSGVRNGADVIKAVALGARGVLIGRAWAYALAARGEKGVADLLSVIREEMAHSMALMGVNSVTELNAGLVDTRNICD